jgi:putative nucleotidyltransferase with HDIG domain
MAMSQTRGCDQAMSNHALVSCTLSLLLGQAVKLDLLQLHNLAMGALLHDVGLLLLPRHLTDGLRNTSHPLSAHDQALYESHPRRGAVYLEQEGNFPLEVRRIVAEHHATGDGKGFPRETNPAWTETTSRILMIADRYDELLSGFGGATPLQPHQALQRLYRDAHDQMLDADLTSLFIKRVGVFPIHSVVELNTGERAVVTDINPDALHLPVVHITHEASGRALIAPARIDLARQAVEDTARSISRVVDSANPLTSADTIASCSTSHSSR